MPHSSIKQNETVLALLVRETKAKVLSLFSQTGLGDGEVARGTGAFQMLLAE